MTDERDSDTPDVDPATDETQNPTPAQAGDNAPLGGDDTTENELASDNAVEDDMLKALDPDAAP